MTAETVEIRRLVSSDLDGVMEIERQAAPKSTYPRRVVEWYASRYPETFLVLEAEGTLAGYIVFGTDGHVFSMAIRPELRRRGLGRMLMDRARATVGGRLWLEVRTKNRGAVAFYRALGMEAVGIVPAYYGDDDALIMLLR